MITCGHLPDQRKRFFVLCSYILCWYLNSGITAPLYISPSVRFASRKLTTHRSSGLVSPRLHRLIRPRAHLARYLHQVRSHLLHIMAVNWTLPLRGVQMLFAFLGMWIPSHFFALLFRTLANHFFSPRIVWRRYLQVWRRIRLLGLPSFLRIFTFLEVSDACRVSGPSSLLFIFSSHHPYWLASTMSTSSVPP